MIAETLRHLLAEGETLDVEFKSEERRALADNDLLEAVICLANRPGNQPGWLVVGVEDNGSVTGARPRHESGRTDPLRVQAMIANRTRPTLSTRAELIALDGVEVLVVEVPASRIPIGSTDGLYKRRAIGGRGTPECLAFHYHEMQAYQADRGQLDYTALTLPDAAWEDLDPLEFERFRRTIRESQGLGDASLLTLPDVELAKALGAVEANHSVRSVRVLGLLLFGKEAALRRLIPTQEAAFQKLSQQRVEVNDFFRIPLLRLMEELMGRFRARYREEELMVGMLRIGVPDYPERAFREGVANALIHRDYSRLGAVHIQWHDDHIAISNPGGFPEGVRLDNLLVTPPRPRNPLLADAFKRAGLVERTARGIDTIFYEQLRNGRPAPSYARSTESDVTLLLPGGAANLNFVRLVVDESRLGRALQLDELLLLNHLWLEREMITSEAAELIQKPESDARSILAQLVEGGLVESRGRTRGRTYHLSANTYRRLGLRSEYVRQQGFDLLQQEQMVLQYVKNNGRITRAEVIELCHLKPDQASRLLRYLAGSGKLRMHGVRRYTFYTLPS